MAAVRPTRPFFRAVNCDHGFCVPIHGARRQTSGMRLHKWGGSAAGGFLNCGAALNDRRPTNAHLSMTGQPISSLHRFLDSQFRVECVILRYNRVVFARDVSKLERVK